MKRLRLTLDFKKLSLLKDFLGKQVWHYLLLAIFLGLAWFVIEGCFLFILQGFLGALGLIEFNKLYLPHWYPKTANGSILFLFVFTLLRSTVAMLRAHISVMSAQAFTKLQRQRILIFGLENAGILSVKDITALITDIINQANYILNFGTMLIISLTSAFFLFIFGTYLAPFEMMFAIIILIIFLLPLRFFDKKINILGKSIIQEWNEISQILILGFKNHFLLKTYNMINVEKERGVTALENIEKHYFKYSLIYALNTSLPLFVGICAIVAATLVSSHYTHTSGHILISFFYVFVRVAQTAGEATNAYTALKIYIPSFEKVFNWYQLSISKKECLTNNIPHSFNIPVSFEDDIKRDGIVIMAKNIQFGYIQENTLFSNLSFDISPGEILIINGESGKGKSTLFLLILGMQKPWQGNLTVNGIPSIYVTDLLSKYIAYAGPDPFLVSGTVRYNLLYGHYNATSVSDKQIWDALSEAKIDEEIRSLKAQLDEDLKEIAQLSTGQKQRLALARAFLRNPKLLLLDEATANLDIETEREILKNLKKKSSHMTTIIISHKIHFNDNEFKKVTIT